MKFEKRVVLSFLLITLVVVFSACTREADVENQEVTIGLQEQEVTGLYTGHTLNGTPEGNGSFEFVDGDSFVRYTGDLSEGNASGLGTLEMSDFTVEFQDKEYVGVFNGAVFDGIPEGTGSFTYEDGDDYLRYKGDFHEGHPIWNGDIEMNDFVVDFGSFKKTGVYSGQIKNGVPNGTGTYDTANSSGYEYTYEGEWKNGIWDGYGKLAFKDRDLTYDRIGTFKQSVFTPDFAEIVDSLGTWQGVPYTMQDKSYTFIKNHFDLFPAKDIAALSGYLDESVGYKHLSKSIEPYLETIVKVRGSIIEIYESNNDNDTERSLFTEVHIYDSNGNNFWCFYPGTLDYYEGDTITVYGLPIGSSSFSNVGGGTTKVQVLALCFVTK